MTSTPSLTSCRYERCAWIPVLVVFIVATAAGGKHFVDVSIPPATASQVFDFGAAIAGFTITWATFSSDYTTYFHPRVSRFVAVASPRTIPTLNLNRISWRIFWYSYLGLIIPIVRVTLAGLVATLILIDHSPMLRSCRGNICHRSP
jgi:purine-cytosine permease-like protein